jgi:hypothetical protein
MLSVSVMDFPTFLSATAGIGAFQLGTPEGRTRKRHAPAPAGARRESGRFPNTPHSQGIEVRKLTSVQAVHLCARKPTVKHSRVDRIEVYLGGILRRPHKGAGINAARTVRSGHGQSPG